MGRMALRFALIRRQILEWLEISVNERGVLYLESCVRVTNAGPLEELPVCHHYPLFAGGVQLLTAARYLFAVDVQ